MKNNSNNVLVIIDRTSFSRLMRKTIIIFIFTTIGFTVLMIKNKIIVISISYETMKKILQFFEMDPALAFEVEEVSRNRIINETILQGNSDVQRFYEDKVIFITGGSGFLGKQLIEKLSRYVDCQRFSWIFYSHVILH